MIVLLVIVVVYLITWAALGLLFYNSLLKFKKTYNKNTHFKEDTYSLGRFTSCRCDEYHPWGYHWMEATILCALIPPAIFVCFIIWSISVILEKASNIKINIDKDE